jgi:hypothetical protein
MAGSGFSISGYNGDMNYIGGSLFDISFIGGQIFPTIVNMGPSTCNPGVLVGVGLVGIPFLSRRKRAGCL